MTKACSVLVGLGLLLLSSLSVAADFTIGYLQLKHDPRYSTKHTYARYLTQPLGRPYQGAKLALKEVKFHGAAADAQFQLQRFKAKDSADVIQQLMQGYQQGIRFFMADLPAEVMAKVAQATKGKDLILLNIAAKENSLRQQHCQAHLLHIIPSQAMLNDALTQYLISRKWREVLVLVGKQPADQALAQAFTRSAKRHGLKIVETRPFELSNDPRKRQQNNIALLTANADYDVVFVADTQGEFARDVPYQTVQPRLVVGTEGLAAMAWHWAWERHGAPQLEKRFEKLAKRPMRDVDWAAWSAVKAIAEAVQRTASTDFNTLRSHMLSDKFILDGFKGKRANFRAWNHQLRQPILLGTHNWVVARAPLDGFLHQSNNLDTLGFDPKESKCEF